MTAANQRLISSVKTANYQRHQHTKGDHPMSNSINLTHIVYCPKYRRKALSPLVARKCEEFTREICSKKGIKVHALAIQPDHVHLFIEIPVTMPVCKAVQLCKWYSSLRIRATWKKEFATFPNKKHFWAKSYWSRSVGGDARTVKKYINNQMKNIH